MSNRILFSLLIAVAASGLAIADDEIVGRWIGTGFIEGEIMEFAPDGSLYLWDENGNPFPDDSDVSLTYEAIAAIEPHQLYVTFNVGEKVERAPFSIYKIVDDQLIMRNSIAYERTYGGLSMGRTTRYEFPADFNGELVVYRRE